MPDAGRRRTRAVAAAVLLAAAVTGGSELLADDDEHALAPANVASLDAALAAVRRSFPGRVLKAELEHEDDGPAAWVYEFKVLTDAGRVLEVQVDAVSLELVGVEGGRWRRLDRD